MKLGLSPSWKTRYFESALRSRFQLLRLPGIEKLVEGWNDIRCAR